MRLIDGNAERLLLDAHPQHLRDRGLVKARGRQRTDSTHAAAVRGSTGLNVSARPTPAALNEPVRSLHFGLAVLFPGAAGLGMNAYSRRVEAYRLPEGRKSERLELAKATRIGAGDGDQLLAAIDAAVERGSRNCPPSVVLHLVWDSSAHQGKRTAAPGWHIVQEMPATAFEQLTLQRRTRSVARYGKKRDISWTWVTKRISPWRHVTPETPHVITNVATTLRRHRRPHADSRASTGWQKMSCYPRNIWSTWAILAAACWSKASSAMGVVAAGPVVEDTSWQAHAAEGFSKADFHVSTGISKSGLAQRGQAEYLSAAEHLSQGRHNAIPRPASRETICAACPDAKPLHPPRSKARAAYQHAAGA